MRSILTMPWRFLGLIAVACMLPGCAALAKKVAHEAAPPAATSGLQALGRPENQRMLDELATSPSARQVTWSLGNAIGNGIIAQILAEAGLGPAPDAAPGAPVLSTRPTTAPTTGAPTTIPATARTFTPQLADRLSEAVGASMHRGIEMALGPDAQARVRQITEAAGEGMMRGVTKGVRQQLAPELDQMFREQLAPAVGEAVRRQIGPAVEDILRQNIAPGAHVVSRETVRGALDTTATGDKGAPLDQDVRELSTAATLGVGDGVAEMRPAPAWGSLPATLERATWIVVAVLTVAGLLLLALVIALFVLALAIWRTRSALVPNHEGAVATGDMTPTRNAKPPSPG